MKRNIHLAITRAAQTQFNGNGFGGRDPTPSPRPFTRTSRPADLQQSGTTAKPKRPQKRFAHVDINNIAILAVFHCCGHRQPARRSSASQETFEVNAKDRFQQAAEIRAIP